MTVFRSCLPLTCRISAQLLSRNYHLVNLPLRIGRSGKWLRSQPPLFIEPSPNRFLTKVLFNTNSPDANKNANDASGSPENTKRLSTKRRRILSESSSSDGENGTQDVNRKSESVLGFVTQFGRTKGIHCFLFSFSHSDRRRAKKRNWTKRQ